MEEKLYYLCNALDSNTILKSLLKLNNLSQRDVHVFKTICLGIDLIEVRYAQEIGIKSMKNLKIKHISTEDALIFKNSVALGNSNNALLKKLTAIHKDYQFDLLEIEQFQEQKWKNKNAR